MANIQMNDTEKNERKNKNKTEILMHFDEAHRSMAEIFAVIQHMRILFMARAFFSLLHMQWIRYRDGIESHQRIPFQMQ